MEWVLLISIPVVLAVAFMAIATHVLNQASPPDSKARPEQEDLSDQED